MKLIVETIEAVKYLTEEKNGVKQYYIEGIGLQGNKVNRNLREYKTPILAREVERYTRDYVDQNRAFGELGHPDGPSINLDRVSHLIKEIRQEGDNFIIKAKILETPFGKIVKSLIDEEAKLGVSSRGMGTLKSVNGVNQVQDDFYLATAADIVADPSAPDAFVRGIMEGKEWVWNNGVIEEATINKMRQEIEKAKRKQLEDVKLRQFESFLSKL
jgi:hypothetical protein